MLYLLFFGKIASFAKKTICVFLADIRLLVKLFLNNFTIVSCKF